MQSNDKPDGFLDQLANTVFDTMLSPDDKQTIIKKNLDIGPNEQVGRRRIEVLPQEKQNIIIRKMFLIYLNSYLRNAERWHLFSNVFYRRHGRGCILVQFKDVENIATNNDKMIIGLSREDSHKVNNFYLDKAIEMYDPNTQFVLCFNVASFIDKKGWFLTCIVDKNTKKACHIDKDDEPAIFEQSITELSMQSMEVTRLLEKDKSTCEIDMKKIQMELYNDLQGFTKFLINNKRSDVLLSISTEQHEPEKMVTDDKKDCDVDSDDDIEDKVQGVQSDLDSKTPLVKKEDDNDESENIKEGKEEEKEEKGKEEEEEDEKFNIIKISPFDLHDFLSDDVKEDEVNKKIKEYTLKYRDFKKLEEQIKVEFEKISGYQELMEEDCKKQEAEMREHNLILETIQKDSLQWLSAKELQNESFNYKQQIVDKNRYFLCNLRKALQEQRNLYNCCNDPCDKTENSLRQFKKNMCMHCNFVIYCSAECLKNDYKRHSKECSSIQTFKKQHSVNVWEKKLEETSEIEYCLVE